MYIHLTWRSDRTWCALVLCALTLPPYISSLLQVMMSSCMRYWTFSILLMLSPYRSCSLSKSVLPRPCIPKLVSPGIRSSVITKVYIHNECCFPSIQVLRLCAGIICQISLLSLPVTARSSFFWDIYILTCCLESNLYAESCRCGNKSYSSSLSPATSDVSLSCKQGCTLLSIIHCSSA